MGNDKDEDMPEAPQIQMVTESFSQVTIKPENKPEKGSDKK